MANVEARGSRPWRQAGWVVRAASWRKAASVAEPGAAQ
jgi:hypothetical protein